jgi:hypothetical protein
MTMTDEATPQADRSATSDAGVAFEAWLDDFLAGYYARRPVDATFIGVHHHDRDLPDYSPQGRAEIVAAMRSLLDRLDSIPTEGLTEPRLIDRRLAAGALELELWEDEARQFYRGNPATYTGEAVFSIISLFQRDSEPLAERVEAACSRMRAIDGFLTQGRTWIEQAPPEWTERAIGECDAAIRYVGTGLPILVQERGIADPDFLAAATEARAAFETHRAWLVDVLSRQTTDDVACGRAAFNRYLRLGH